jgi:hypothetical protein
MQAVCSGSVQGHRGRAHNDCASISSIIMDDYSLEGVDLSFLVGATLIQVAIGYHEVILHTEPRRSIMVASDVRVSTDSDEPRILDSARDIGVAFLPLLGQAIVQAVDASHGNLMLRWTDGTTTEILNTFPNYESFTITHPGGIIVV